MEIKPPSSTSLQPVSGSTPVTPQNSVAQGSLPPDWKIAQLIEAVIIKITDKQIFLDLQGRIAHTAKPKIANLQQGDILRLQIKQLGPLPQFRIVDVRKNINTNLVAQTLTRLNSQQPTSLPLMKNMAFVASRPSLRPAPLAALVNAAVREVVRTIPTPANIKTATQIKSLIENSGVFVEQKLRNQILASIQPAPLNKNTGITKPELQLDLRVQLLRLADLIRSQPLLTSKPLTPVTVTNSEVVAQSANQVATPTSNRPETVRSMSTAVAETQASLQNITLRDEAMHTFLRQVESALTHMQQTQLQNLNESQSGRPVWVFELPIKDGQDLDLFKLRISEDEESHSRGEEKKSWSVTLEFDFAGLGPVKSQVKLQDNYISALFFSEKSETLSLLNENFDFLRSRLNYNGLNVGNLEGVQKNLSAELPITRPSRLDECT